VQPSGEEGRRSNASGGETRRTGWGGTHRGKPRKCPNSQSRGAPTPSPPTIPLVMRDNPASDFPRTAAHTRTCPVGPTAQRAPSPAAQSPVYNNIRPCQGNRAAQIRPDCQRGAAVAARRAAERSQSSGASGAHGRPAQNQPGGTTAWLEVTACGRAGSGNAFQHLSASARRRHVVGLVGVEPTTLPLSGARSGQVSYRPKRNADGHPSRGPERRPSAVARLGSGLVPTGKVAHRHFGISKW
jgi:hypothetical protein